LEELMTVGGTVGGIPALQLGIAAEIHNETIDLAGLFRNGERAFIQTVDVSIGEVSTQSL
jgi:hypothetical protein